MMQILPIASGKGGVGKSLVAANISIALAQAGKRVVLADLDLGGSNMHMMLGISNIKTGIGNFITNENINFKNIVLNTEYQNLRFIPGDMEIPEMADLRVSQKRKLLYNLFSLDADYIVIDLGAGTHKNVLDFFLCSGSGIIVTAPNLTATLDAYLFLKNILFRIMYSCFKRKSPGRTKIEELKKEGKPLQKVYIPGLLREIEGVDPEGSALYREKVSKFRPRLILNLLENPGDAGKALKFKRSCKEYLDLEVGHLGVIYKDKLQTTALNSRLPVIIYKPDCLLSQAVYRITDKLIQEEIEGGSLLDFQSLEDSYLTAEMEADLDFKLKGNDIEELLHCGALSMNDLFDTVKSQQLEIQRLRSENLLVKEKLSDYLIQDS